MNPSFLLSLEDFVTNPRIAREGAVLLMAWLWEKQGCATWGSSSRGAVPQAPGAEEHGLAKEQSHHAPAPTLPSRAETEGILALLLMLEKQVNVPKALETKPGRELYSMFSLSPENCLFISSKGFIN